jgi:cytochrome P450
MRLSPACPVFDVAGAAAGGGLLRVSEQGARRFGDIFRLRFEDGSETLLLAAAEHVGQWHGQSDAFEKDFDHLPTSAALTRLLLGPSLLTARQGEEWSRMRKQMTTLMRLASPWFTRCLASATQTLLEEVESRSDDPRGIPLMPLAIDWAVRSVCGPILGPDVPHSAAVDLVESLQSCFLVMTGLSSTQAQDYRALPSFVEAKAKIDRVLEATMASARNGGDTIAAACLSTLPSGLDEHEQKDAVGSVVIGLIAASLHINALALVWTLASLARYPTLAKRIADESAGVGLSAADQVTKTPLAFAAVRETQRLYPALPFIERRLARDMVFSGYSAPAGTMVLFANWLIHRDPRYWTEPKSYDAARFLPRASQVPNSYFPFGVGPRTCSGMNLVFQQLTFASRALLTRFDLALADGTRPGDLMPIMQVNLEPRGDIWVQVRPRRHHTSPIRPINEGTAHA